MLYKMPSRQFGLFVVLTKLRQIVSRCRHPCGLNMGRELEPREIVGAVQAALPGMTVVDLTPFVSERGFGILNTLLKKDKTLYVLPNCKGVRKTLARSGQPCKPGSIRYAFEQCDKGQRRLMVTFYRGTLGISAQGAPIKPLEVEIEYLKKLCTKGDTCCICCERIFKKDCGILKCGHSVHMGCFDKWETTQMQQDRDVTCPVCRHTFR